MAYRYKGEWVTVLADSRRGEYVTIQFKDGRTMTVKVSELS